MRTVPPVFFNLNKQLEMNAMAQQFLDVAARANPNRLQTTRTLANHDLLLRLPFHHDQAIYSREILAHFFKPLGYNRRDVWNLVGGLVQNLFADDFRDEAAQ